MTELLAGVVLAFAALALVLEPLVKGAPRSMAAAGAPASDGDIEFTDIEESESPKIQALLALKEIEFDRATGKLSDADYASMKASYQRAALVAIEQEETGSEDALADAVAICPSCGPRPEATAKFCSSCGGTLTARTQTAPFS